MQQQSSSYPGKSRAYELSVIAYRAVAPTPSRLLATAHEARTLACAAGLLRRQPCLPHGSGRWQGRCKLRLLCLLRWCALLHPLKALHRLCFVAAQRRRQHTCDLVLDLQPKGRVDESSYTLNPRVDEMHERGGSWGPTTDYPHMGAQAASATAPSFFNPLPAPHCAPPRFRSGP